MTPQQVTAEVTASGIQGRGGANFSAGRKWSVVNLSDGQPHYLCANADEGEPGTFKDRWILENAPHLLLESMLIAAFALQVRHAFIYVRGEFDLPYRRIAGALDEAYARAISASRSSAPSSPATSSSTGAPARTSAARPRACSRRSRASAAIRATARRASRCAGSTSGPRW
jgi:Na+-translocating ferredoxin:NAD+ oxidoreductase RnfC subunit